MESVSRNDISFALSFVLSIIIINALNPAIKDFFLNPFIVFSILLFAMFNRNKNLPVSFAGAFIASIVIMILTMDDPMLKAKETFELIFPTPDSSLKFNKITVKDLENKFGGKEALLKTMAESDVPQNLDLTDYNAPEIATYLETNNMIMSKLQ